MDFDLAITIRRPPEAVWPVLDDIQAYAGTPGSCVLHQRETLTPHGPLRLVAGPMEGILRPRLEHRLEEIRDLVEVELPAPA